MRVVDSGVAIAAFASWHESHDIAADELRGRPQISAHALVETYSVLTRLPAPHRAPSGLVGEWLESVFQCEPLTLSTDRYRQLVTKRLPALGLAGGPTYDAVIAATVDAAGGTLVTLDRRALATYERIGCPAVLLAGGS